MFPQSPNMDSAHINHEDGEPPCRHCDGTGVRVEQVDVDVERECACEHCCDSFDDNEDADRDDGAFANGPDFDAMGESE